MWELDQNNNKCDATVLRVAREAFGSFFIEECVESDM